MTPAAALESEFRVPTRVELEPDGSVDVFVDEDEEALLVTAQDGVRGVSHAYYIIVYRHSRRVRLRKKYCLNSKIGASFYIDL